ncbi:MAG TPA: hypothetical protein VG269_09830 [Tepidisphaeraceae bacterium]|jgi:hypothetical protein|nr:hypothetical protein [Tepidisphaeraceae bacterium]
MRRIIVLLVVGLVLAGALGGAFLFHQHQIHNEEADFRAPHPVVRAVAETPEFSGAKWVANHDAAHAQRIARLSALIRQLDDERTRAAGAVALVNLPGDVLPELKAAIRGGAVAAGPLAALQGALPMIEQRAVLERRRQDSRERLLEAASAAYNRYGSHDPRWDAAALDAMAAYFHAPPACVRTVEEETAISKAFDWVCNHVECNDPLVRSVHGMMAAEFGVDEPAASLEEFKWAAKSMPNSDYPREWKAFPAFAYVRSLLPTSRSKSSRYLPVDDPRLDEFRASFPDLAGARFIGASEKCDAVRTYLERRAEAHPQVFDREKEFTPLYAALDKAYPGAYEPMVLKGRFLVDFAWDARGGGFANDVTEEGWKLFAKRLATAEQTLTKAWEMNPSDPRAATIMITVAMGTSAERPQMEKWFHRAVQADPDNLAACEAKLLYLDPRWKGSVQDLDAFSRECRDTHNYAGRIALMYVTAQRTIAWMTDSPADYLGDPHVFDDIRRLFEEYQATRTPEPDDLAMYAGLTACIGHWADANRIFQSVPPQHGRMIYLSRTMGHLYEDLRTEAARLAADPANAR